MSYWVAAESGLSGYSTPASTSKSAVVGDFIYFAFKNTNKVDHIAFITKKSGSTAYYTQKTTDKVNARLDTLDGSPYFQLYILKVN